MSWLDLRVWLACFEAIARRCGLQQGRFPQYTVRELTVMVGSTTEGAVRRSISRLHRIGLLVWSPSALEIGHSLPSLPGGESGTFSAVLEQVANHSRRVPVPRRVLRWLAKDGNRVVVATVLGHLLRCLYYRNGTCRPTGTCKASWLGETFGVDVRNVKAARKALVADGLLKVERRSQWFLNRHGFLVTVNLAWGPGTAQRRRLPPPWSKARLVSPPPEKKPELLRKMNDQKPSPTVAGLCAAASALSAPNLRHVVQADLTDPGRLAVLHEQARDAGYVDGGEADRLKFFGAATHALVVAKRNAPGLFAEIVRRGLWRVLTLGDEDRARHTLGGRYARPAFEHQCERQQKPARLADILPSVIALAGSHFAREPSQTAARTLTLVQPSMRQNRP
ncbi:MAG: hypothetical protein KA354_23640 [Phycisphaerae bacterium]|nr:hypothetical protein [Phycisphaerae bacterium]